MAEELDLITAIDLIEAVEKSPYYGDYDFLKKTLGCDTFKKMLKLGYIHGGEKHLSMPVRFIKLYAYKQKHKQDIPRIY
jgi:hypothetical protein